MTKERQRAASPGDTTAEAEFRKVEHPLADLFPASRKGSALIVAVLVRSDEITHMIRWMQRASDEEADRASLGDPRQVLDRVILVRLLLVSLTDGVDKLQQFMNLPEIGAAVKQTGAHGAELRRDLRQLRSDLKNLMPLRNKLGGHLDPVPICQSLARVQPSQIGVMWLAESEHLQTQYDCAHEIAMGAWAGIAGVQEPQYSTPASQQFQAMFGQAQHAQAKFVSAARIALHLFEATAPVAPAPSAPT